MMKYDIKKYDYIIISKYFDASLAKLRNLPTKL